MTRSPETGKKKKKKGITLKNGLIGTLKRIDRKTHTRNLKKKSP